MESLASEVKTFSLIAKEEFLIHLGIKYSLFNH